MPPKKKNSVSARVFWVVVLGDFGRSPRMQYHALSLSRLPRAKVEVVALGGSQPLPELVQSGNVQINTISELPSWAHRLPRPARLILKVLFQLSLLLWLMLVSLPRPCTILLQNPPAIPTMAVCRLAALRHGARLVIDWHNFGYTILALGMGQRHWMVRLAHMYERWWGKAANANFCVTRAMQLELQAGWGIKATVLYDRPPATFQRTPLLQVHDLFSRLERTWADPRFTDCLGRLLAATPGSEGSLCSLRHAADRTLVTLKEEGSAQWQQPRPAIVISSTSWTPDEDFSILLEAAQLYDKAASQAPILPDILFLITGKGPQKELYLRRLQQLQFSRVAFRTLWLEPEDYPLLLGAADIGVSLHASSSGLDLPMKVVDMFGSGLPVCALSYSCIHELVSDGETGLLFSNAEQLSQHLQSLLHGFPAKPSNILKQMQDKVHKREQGLRWDDNWNKVALSILQQV